MLNWYSVLIQWGCHKARYCTLTDVRDTGHPKAVQVCATGAQLQGSAAEPAYTMSQ